MTTYRVKGKLNYLIWEDGSPLDLEVEADSPEDAKMIAGALHSHYEPEAAGDHFYFEQEPEVQELPAPTPDLPPLYQLVAWYKSDDHRFENRTSEIFDTLAEAQQAMLEVSVVVPPVNLLLWEKRNGERNLLYHLKGNENVA
jgi:hypothetical protein